MQVTPLLHFKHTFAADSLCSREPESDRRAVPWSVLREMGFFLLFGSKAGGARGVWWCVESPLTAHVLHRTSTAKFNLICTVDFTGVA